MIEFLQTVIGAVGHGVANSTRALIFVRRDEEKINIYVRYVPYLPLPMINVEVTI